MGPDGSTTGNDLRRAHEVRDGQHGALVSNLRGQEKSLKSATVTRKGGEQEGRRAGEQESRRKRGKESSRRRGEEKGGWVGRRVQVQEKNRMKGSSEVTRVSHIVETLTMREALGRASSSAMR